MSVEGNASISCAPEERNVYSTSNGTIPQAPAGRHVCRIEGDQFVSYPQ